jgi:hypothetical protein
MTGRHRRAYNPDAMVAAATTWMLVQTAPVAA